MVSPISSTPDPVIEKMRQPSCFLPSSTTVPGCSASMITARFTQSLESSQPEVVALMSMLVRSHVPAASTILAMEDLRAFLSWTGWLGSVRYVVGGLGGGGSGGCGGSCGGCGSCGGGEGGAGGIGSDDSPEHAQPEQSQP